MIKAASRIHKKTFERYVAQAGVTITLRFPAARPATPATAATKVLGQRVNVVPPTDVNPDRDMELQAIWSTSYNVSGPGADSVPEKIARLGRASNLDAVLRLVLDDALADPEAKQSRSYFDEAAYVLYMDERYKVTGTDRTGLPPEGPYILWVALQKSE